MMDLNQMFIDKTHKEYRDDIEFISGTAGGERLKGKHILLTGATGLIGVVLTDALLNMGARVTATGRSRERAKKRLGDHFADPRFTFIEQDATEPFDPTIRPDVIIPLASNTHPLAYSTQPVETIMTNILGARHALELAKECSAEVLYPSTVEVYGNARGDDRFDESYTGALNLQTARSCYNESKRTAEALCQSYGAEHGVRFKIARLSRIFGPTMLRTDTKASSQFIIKALAGEDIVLKSKGEQLFSYTYAADAAAAMLHILTCGEQGQAYNISNAKCDVRLKDFAGLCAEYCGQQVIFDLPSEAEAAGYSKASVALMDNSKLLSTGFEPRYDMRSAVWRTLNIMSQSR